MRGLAIDHMSEEGQNLCAVMTLIREAMEGSPRLATKAGS